MRCACGHDASLHRSGAIECRARLPVPFPGATQRHCPCGRYREAPPPTPAERERDSAEARLAAIHKLASEAAMDGTELHPETLMAMTKEWQAVPKVRS